MWAWDRVLAGIRVYYYAHSICILVRVITCTDMNVYMRTCVRTSVNAHTHILGIHALVSTFQDTNLGCRGLIFSVAVPQVPWIP